MVVQQIPYLDLSQVKRFQKPVFNAIRLGVENYITNLEREKYLRTRILEAVYSLEYQSDQEQLKTLSHMQVHMGKLSLDLLQQKEIES